MLMFRGSANLGYCNFGEWRIWPDDLIPVELGADTSFEHLLTRYSTHCLRVIMADLVPLGTAGNGDGYYAFVDVMQPDATAVYMYDHEEGGLDVFADAISTLADLNRLYEIADDTSGSGDPMAEIKKGMKRIEERVNPSWHYRD